MRLLVRTTGVDVAKIVAYVEQRQVADGGFFFARVPPANASDTYHAVEILRLLGAKPARSLAVRAWLREAAANGGGDHPAPIFYLAMAALALGVPRALVRSWVAPLDSFKNAEGGFGSWRHLDVEISSELESTYYATTALERLGMAFDEARVSQFVRHFQNVDGGFGAEGRSTLASTYYAASILTQLGSEKSLDLGPAAAWLRERDQDFRVLYYLEQLYWLVGALTTLGMPLGARDEAISFVLGCRHPSGGFARSPNIGIATLEYTHQAVGILRALEAF